MMGNAMSAIDLNKYCYSLDGEQYHGRFGTRLSAQYGGQIDADNNDYEDGEEVTIYVGQCKQPLDIIDSLYRRECIGELLDDQIDEWTWDEVVAEDRIIELTRDQQKELGGIVMEYMKAHASQNYYGVGDVTEHSYIVGTDDLCESIAAYVRAELGKHIATLKGETA